jgi:signal peptidase I
MALSSLGDIAARRGVWGEVSGPQDGGAPQARGTDPAAGPGESPRAAAEDSAAQAQAGQYAETGPAETTSAETTSAEAGPAGTSGAGREPGADPGPEAAGADGGKRKQRSFWRELPILVVVALLLAILIKTFAVQAFYIPSGSMENTLLINDRVLVNKIVYHTRSIHRGDIVVFNGDGSWDPGTIPVTRNVFQQFADGFSSMFGFGAKGDILIKRVIGIPGDHVVCCNAAGQITVNGVALSEQSYLYPGAAPSVSKFDITVQPGRLWVQGDNRFFSDDSRDHQGDPGGGTVPESAVVGRAFVIIWPPSRWRILPIPATFTQSALTSSHASTGPVPLSAQAAAAAPLPAQGEPTGQVIPLALGFAGALPLTWLQRRVRLRRRRGDRTAGGRVARLRSAARRGPDRPR